ncbi:MAG TPA: hypothetical protein VGV59_11040 [Pyrinomonadaceae bacterium]|nr:hypothetical protein [Pyrinomonadaceae bacterium]
MRQLLSLAALAAAVSLAASCGGGELKRADSNTTKQNSNASTTLAHGPSQTPAPPISSAHGGAQAPAASSEKPSLATPELDAKIERAEARAKAAGATASDKKAAAEAYFERADTYREAGSPQLYKFALGDYRRGLRYDPTDADAKAKMEEIVQIYQSMNRPVPPNGLEQ